MTLTGDGAPRVERRPSVADMTSSQLRKHLADEHGTRVTGYVWLEMVAEHNRSHRVWLKLGHEHDPAYRPEPI